MKNLGHSYNKDTSLLTKATLVYYLNQHMLITNQLSCKRNSQ
jgi:hypothetical protein